MSILGTVVRVKPEHLAGVCEQLAQLPGLDIALNPGDGRLVVVLEDSAQATAAQTMARMALIPEVLNTSLVYEYSGADAMHAGESSPAETQFKAWRSTLTEMANAQVPEGNS